MTTSNPSKTYHDRIYASGAEAERSYKQYMRQLLPPGQGRTLLDIGCGTGMNTALFKNKGYAVYGVDVSHEAILKLRERGLSGRTMDFSAPLTDQLEPFDVVFCSEVIEHAVDTKTFLDNIFSCLNPGGELYLSTPNSAFWAYRALAVLGYTVTELQHPDHVRFFSKRSLRRALRRSGFEIDEVHSRNIYLLFGDRLPTAIKRTLQAIGFSQEPRFASGRTIFLLSRMARRASSFFADTLIVKAKRAP